MTRHSTSTTASPSAVTPSVSTARAFSAVVGGGMIGATARCVISTAFPVVAGSMPWSTLSINVLGAFVLGVIAAVLHAPRWETLRLLLCTGVLGAFTTFSAFSIEMVQLSHTRLDLAFAYASGSVVAGLIAAAAGLFIGRSFARQRPDVEDKA